MKLLMDSQELERRVRERIEQLHSIAPGSIGDVMTYEVLSCDAERGEVQLRCRTFDWMRNGPGTLHGGMCATVVDQAMGFVAYCIKPGEGTAPTVQLQVSYHRPLFPGETVLVTVGVASVTKTLMHLRAEVSREAAPEKLCLSATSVFFYRPEQE